MITLEGYKKLLSMNCNKQKHRFRTNHYGVTWCVICGTLSSKPSQLLKSEEILKIE